MYVHKYLFNRNQYKSYIQYIYQKLDIINLWLLPIQIYKSVTNIEFQKNKK